MDQRDPINLIRLRSPCCPWQRCRRATQQADKLPPPHGRPQTLRIWIVRAAMHSMEEAKKQFDLDFWMSQLGQTQKSGCSVGRSALPSITDFIRSCQHVSKVPDSDIGGSLFDHLIGAT